ncbi:DUF6544 family protein [Pontibacter locisalis]|uniref:DUF6544 family protein n=1 Tax=Pontibacter locisalis TaxID=1719035 RepID=A0ABW5IU77_9BACT
MSIKDQFLEEVQEELRKGPALQQSLTPEDLEKLPPLMKNYLQQSGHLGKPLATNCFILYDHAAIKLKPDRDWLKLDCQQFNSSLTTTRIALMRSKLFKIIPFSGKDKYQNNQGNMLIQLAGFTVSDANGPEMNKAALVTYLSESVLLPSAILDPNIKWQEVESRTLRGTINHAGISVSGLFLFNDQNEIYEFQTEDRYYASNSRSYKRTRWSAFLRDYKIVSGYRIPTTLSAVWHLPEGDYEYFKGTLKEIKYGIDSLPDITRGL